MMSKHYSRKSPATAYRVQQSLVI